MAGDPLMDGQGSEKALPIPERGCKSKDAHGGCCKPKKKCHGSKGYSSIRKPVLALCKVTNAAAANQISNSLKAALLEAERLNEPVDGGLLGMAAAQAGRLGLKDLLGTLCAYSWPRLFECGGREVAELAAAASKCGCSDERFFCFVGAYCCQKANSFTCLRDVALVSAALTRKLDSEVDLAGAFHGLSFVTLQHLHGTTTAPIRDVAEFFYSLVNVLGMSNGSGLALCAASVTRDVIVAIADVVRPQLHMASAQDIAKTTGAAAVAWGLLPQLQEKTMLPLLMELAQAVRFRHADFNVQDLAHLCAAFAKVDTLSSCTSLPVLLDKVLGKLADFSAKDLSLVLWAATRHGYIGERCAAQATQEVMKRDLSSFSTQDLCMTAQCLAKLGARGKAALCLVAGQVFVRQAQGLNTTDKVLFLWALAKCKVMHLALCRLLVRDLAVEKCGMLARDKVGLALWSLAVVWPTLPEGEAWPQLLANVLLSAQPWLMAPSYEVTNAAWAFAQLPPDMVARSWPSLLQTTTWVHPKQLSEHELCNLLAGLSSCTLQVGVLQEAFRTFSTELVARFERCSFSQHDKRLLASAVSSKPIWESLEASLLDKIKAFLGMDERRSAEEEEEPTSYPQHSHEQEEQEAEEEYEEAEAKTDPEDSAPPEALPSPKKAWNHGSCRSSCCTEVPGTSELSRLRLNSHCDYKGHCVQLKHTFIHVDCPTNSDSEEDCELCRISRRRARSVDSKEPGPGLTESDVEAHMQRRLAAELNSEGRQRRELRSGSCGVDQ
ncbi:unnamed protein product [Effrenium voratum]|uniref:Uncharacterized protein n=1 Tax=Effrenium voratum TaxID=2562239 RepID=A0AA36NK26_9DINO|nr:unnamed protein product [Effrenium voratum]CAJ1437666.1 unnamed protein product [Effrenium voratum]